MTQAAHLALFFSHLRFAEVVVQDAHATAGPAGAFAHPLDRRQFTTESAVVRIHVAWERFLESSFVGYLMGEPSTSGRTVATYLGAPSREHAMKVLVGNGKYVDCGNPDIVRRLAANYFAASGPYKNVLDASNSDLFDLRNIRNAAAHLSSTSTQHLDALAQRRLGWVRTGTTVYDVIMARDSTANVVLLDDYVQKLEAAATQIAAA